MRPLTLAVLLAFFQASLAAPRQKPQNASGGAKKENAGTAPNEKPTVPPPTVNAASPPIAEENTQRGAYVGGQGELPVRVARVEGEVNVKKDWPDYIYIGSTLVVALISLFLALTAKTQARAAQLSAQAVMDSERPWLLVEKSPTQDRIQDPCLLRVQQMATERRLPHCIFFLKNYGKTVAKGPLDNK